MILWHCSTVKIDNFYIPYGGLHFGGINSALEAALRKVRVQKKSSPRLVYVHKCELLVQSVYDCEDLCGADDWERHIEYMKQHETDKVLRYTNKYEPDTVQSYMIWDSSLVKILEVSVLKQDEAETLIRKNLCLM